MTTTPSPDNAEQKMREACLRDKQKYHCQWSDSTMPITPEEDCAYEAGYKDGWQAALASHKFDDDTNVVSKNEALKEVREELVRARNRIEYLGIQHHSESHYLSNIRDYLPRTDKALATLDRLLANNEGK